MNKGLVGTGTADLMALLQYLPAAAGIEKGQRGLIFFKTVKTPAN